MFALLPAAHPLAAAAEVGLPDLVGEDWAVPAPNDDMTRDYWISALAGTGARPRTPYEAEGRLLVDIVRAGWAVSFCQATFDEVPGVAVRPITGDPLWYRHLLAWREAGPIAPLGEQISERVVRWYARTRDLSPAYARWRTRDRARA